jgi:hypothetical protein
VRIERVTVGDTRIEATLRFEPDEPLRTSEVPGLPERALAALPDLSRHRCDNAEGRIFADELRDTELAHLVEHVACELMAASGSPRGLRGETAWDFARDGRGVFHVTLEFDDDLVALGALKAASAVVEALVRGSDVPDARAAAERLRSLRGSRHDEA